MSLFEDLKLFMAVAKHGRFALAAKSAKLTAGMVSAHIADLERRLGVQLFYRTSRLVRLTYEGELLFQRVPSIIERLEKASGGRTAQVSERSGYVIVGAPSAVSRSLLMPALNVMRLRYPSVTVEINHTDADSAAAGSLYDVFFCYGVPENVQFTPLGPYRIITAAAPNYLDIHGAPDHPRDIVDHACLSYLNPIDATPIPWRFDRHGETHVLTPAARLLFDHTDGQIEAAAEGEGLVNAPDYALFDYLRRGLVQPVLTAWAPAGSPIGVGLSKAGSSNPAAIALVDTISRLYPNVASLIEALGCISEH